MARFSPLRNLFPDSSVSDSTLQTSGGLLPNGNTVDLVTDDPNRRLQLIWFDGTRYHSGDHVCIKGDTFVPIALDPSVLNAVVLPAKVSDHGSANELFAATRAIFSDFGFSEIGTAITLYVFANWFPEPSLPAPCLTITGPCAEATLLLQLLGCLVRRGLAMFEFDTHAFRGSIQHLQPTILIDARHCTPRELQKLLASSRSRAYVSWKGSLVDSSLAKVIYLGPAPINDCSDFSVHVHVAPSRKVPLLPEVQRNKIIATFQPQFLDYYLHNLASVRSSEFDLTTMDSDCRVLAHLFGRAIVNAPDVQAYVRPLVENRQTELTADRWSDPVCVIIEALLDISHCPPSDVFYVGQVAEKASALLKARGARTKLEPRSVGPILRRLGLVPRKNRKGCGLVLTDEIVQLIHRLARDYRVAAAREGIARCAVCRDVFNVATATEVHSG